MTYIDSNVFIFIKHWNLQERKFFAACCYNIFKMYKLIDDKEKLQLTISKLLQIYKRKGPTLLCNDNLVGTIRVEISRVNSKNRKTMNFATSDAIEQIESHEEEVNMELLMRDIEKLIGRKKFEVILKKYKGETLSKTEHETIYRVRKELGEYFRI